MASKNPTWIWMKDTDFLEIDTDTLSQRQPKIKYILTHGDSLKQSQIDQRQTWTCRVNNSDFSKLTVSQAFFGGKICKTKIFQKRRFKMLFALFVKSGFMSKKN